MNSHGEDLAGAVFRDCDLTGARFVDCRLVDVSLSGWMERLEVNDVDVTAYVCGELDSVKGTDPPCFLVHCVSQPTRRRQSRSITQFFTL